MKKVMVALTGLVTVATFGAALPAVSPATVAQAAKKSTSPSLSVDTINAKSTKITGTATKGSKITVKASKNAKKNLATATAASKTGKYTVKLSKKLAKNSDVYVYATNPKTKAYFYRIIRVQAAAAKKASAAKATTKKATATKKTTSKKSSKSFTVKTPTGTWKSNRVKGYTNTWSFSQKNGLNETLYKNGKKVKTLVSYGNYNVDAKTPTFWKVTYKGHGEKKRSTMYLRFTSASQFKLVNSKNQASKIKVGSAPAAAWTFNK